MFHDKSHKTRPRSSLVAKLKAAADRLREYPAAFGLDFGLDWDMVWQVQW